MMNVISAAMMFVLAAAPAERPTIVVQAPDSPVRLERATILSGSEGPPVLLYAATNRTDQELEQFTVTAFVFAADGKLKAKQLAPGRRTLEARSTKYSTMVLDGSPIEPTDVIVVGVDQAQRAGSEVWWRSDLQPAAIAAAQPKKP
jgi:hypothetical protein